MKRDCRPWAKQWEVSSDVNRAALNAYLREINRISLLTPEEERDPARRFRGRLAAPVTVVTAGTVKAPVGLTVSSVMVIEGDPPLVHVLLGPTTDLWLTLDPEDPFVVQVLRQEDRVTADRLAGLAPSPGGIRSAQCPVALGWRLASLVSIQYRSAGASLQYSDRGNRSRRVLTTDYSVLNTEY